MVTLLGEEKCEIFTNTCNTDMTFFWRMAEFRHFSDRFHFLTVPPPIPSFSRFFRNVLLFVLSAFRIVLILSTAVFTPEYHPFFLYTFRCQIYILIPSDPHLKGWTFLFLGS